MKTVTQTTARAGKAAPDGVTDTNHPRMQSKWGVQGLFAAPLWLGLVALPLAMNEESGFGMISLFPEEWRQNEWDQSVWPGPLGLILGISAVAIGMVFLVGYHWLHMQGAFGLRVPVQAKGAPKYGFWEGVVTHVSNPEGFVLLGGYLCGTWMFNLMPPTYYSFDGGIVWWQVLLQLLVQDCVQYGMHMLEHAASTEIYKRSHKPHHRFTNPRLFDAFNGSLADTFLMILLPLYATANLVHCNVWTYMAFGSVYANWLTLIHSEYPHSWDPLFRLVGFGTAADHHVHHKLFKYNYGHLFMYWDMLAGTYRAPATVTEFNLGV